jgi:hypothetical protein
MKPLFPLMLALLALACSREPELLHARMNTARTSPATVADWIIQGRNDFLLVDLRPAAEYRRGHVPGAVNVEPARLAQPAAVRTLPDYKKLVFYGAEDQQVRLLAPLFQRGLNVLILEGGYEGWVKTVMTRPTSLTSPDEVRRDAVSKHFRGESALGTPQPLRELPAQQYIRPPSLPPPAEKPPQSEGC